jgi:hypothetical protein
MGRRSTRGQVRQPKSIDDDLITTIAVLAIRTGIAPRELLETPSPFIVKMIELVNETAG